MSDAVVPPDFPLGRVYTPYYCEENIYLLAESFHRNSAISQAWEINVVFVSNVTKTVALWDQALSSDPDRPVVWDYHCILVLRPRLDTLSDSSWVFDYDSRLAKPCPWQGELFLILFGWFHYLSIVSFCLVEFSMPLDYIQATFKSDLCSLLPPQYRRYVESPLHHNSLVIACSLALFESYRRQIFLTHSRPIDRTW
jgi:hypothetical protein